MQPFGPEFLRSKKPRPEDEVLFDVVDSWHHDLADEYEKAKAELSARATELGADAAESDPGYREALGRVKGFKWFLDSLHAQVHARVVTLRAEQSGELGPDNPDEHLR